MAKNSSVTTAFLCYQNPYILIPISTYYYLFHIITMTAMTPRVTQLKVSINHLLAINASLMESNCQNLSVADP